MGMEWQKIETAPRDGTHILAVFQRNPESIQQVYEVWFDPKHDRSTKITYEWQSWENAFPDDDDKLTDWMPIPILPEVLS